MPVGVETQVSTSPMEKGVWFARMAEKIGKEAKKFVEEKAGETSKKKGSSGKSSSSSKTKGGGSGADKAKRAAKEFFK